MVKLALCFTALLFYVILGALVFLCAGTIKLPFFWACLLIPLVTGLVGTVTLDEELLLERAKPKGEDKDQGGVLLLGSLYFLSLSIPALDVGRWHFATFSNLPLQICACATLLVSHVLLLWCMRTNSFFSTAVRLQPDRDQKVVDIGPYSVIRHPGYATGALMFLSTATALGSYLGFIPAVLMICSLAYRSLLEEKILIPDLPGYAQYAQRVRYRWILGIW